MKPIVQAIVKTGLWLVCGAIVAACVTACVTASEPVLEVNQGSVIRNVTVVSTRDGALSPGMAVVIDAGRIQRVLPDRGVRAAGKATVVDGSGKFVVPGYLDMHTHALAGADSPSPFWTMLVAHGVTGIREMAGSAALIQRAKQVNADRAAGKLLAPEILQVPGDIIGGAPSGAVAAQMVRKHKADGADFVKIVAGSREVTLAVLTEARAQGLGVAGHLPLALNSAEAAANGWRAVEHLGSGIGMLLECATDEPRIRRALLNGEGAKPVLEPAAIVSPMLFRTLDAPFFQQVLDSFSAERCAAVAQAAAKSGTWQVPTLIRLRTMDFSDQPVYRNDPNLQYVDKTRRALWASLADRYASSMPPAAAATFRSYYAAQLRLVGQMQAHAQAQGAKLLAGSDLGGIWVIPGAGLHQEFAELAAAGLSPLQVLQATTINGAMFLGREASMGTVEAGRQADLVLLDANPLTNVANLGRIAGVMLGGLYLSAGELAQLKRDVAVAYSQQPLQNLAAAYDNSHRH